MRGGRRRRQATWNGQATTGPSGIAFRDNFVYYVYAPVYAVLNGATITVDNCYALDDISRTRNGTLMQPACDKTEAGP